MAASSSSSAASAAAVVLVGGRACGKTIFLKKLLDVGDVGPTTPSFPTIGINVETLPVIGSDKDTVTVAELGSELAPLWSAYMRRRPDVIFLVDVSSPHAIAFAGVHLVSCLSALSSAAAAAAASDESVASDESAAHLLLVYAKVDQVSERSVAEIRALLRVDHLRRGGGGGTRAVQIDEVQYSAWEGRGLPEIRRWLRMHCHRRK